MKTDLAARFKAFADSCGPIDIVDADADIIGADLHEIATSLDSDRPIQRVAVIHELDLAGGAQGLRPLRS